MFDSYMEGELRFVCLPPLPQEREHSVSYFNSRGKEADCI